MSKATFILGENDKVRVKRLEEFLRSLGLEDAEVRHRRSTGTVVVIYSKPGEPGDETE